MRTGSLGIVTLALAAAILAGHAGCSDASESSVSSAGAGGAGGKSGSAGKAGGGRAGSAQAGAAPVDLPVLPAQDGILELAPDPVDYSCGPGCRPVFSVSYRSTPISRATTTPSGTVDTDGYRILFADLAAGSPTWTVGHADRKIAYLSNPALTPSYVVSLRSRMPVPKTPEDQKEVLVWDRKTGAVVHAIPLPGITIPAGWPDSEPIVLSQWDGAAASDELAIYSYVNRMYRVTFETGEVKNIASGLCWTAQLIGREYLCADVDAERFRSVDVDTGVVTELSPGPGRQAEGSCSFDGKLCVWVDYRDPPGLTDAGWYGGEIYMLERPSGVLKRLTFDSPSTPRLKFFAAVEGDLVTWREGSQPQQQPGEPHSGAGLDRVVRFDLSKGTRCWFPWGPNGLDTIHLRQLVGHVNDADLQGDSRPDAFDLDSAEIPWTCDPAAPAPVVVSAP